MFTARRLNREQHEFVRTSSNLLNTVASLHLQESGQREVASPQWPAEGLRLQINTSRGRENIFEGNNADSAFLNALQNLGVNLNGYNGTAQNILDTYDRTHQLPGTLQNQIRPGSLLARRLDSFVGNWGDLRLYATVVDTDHDNILSRSELDAYKRVAAGETETSASHRARQASVDNAETIFPSLLLYVRFSNSDTQVVDGQERVRTLESSVSRWQWALPITAGSLLALGLTAFFVGRSRGADEARTRTLAQISEATNPDVLRRMEPHLDAARNLRELEVADATLRSAAENATRHIADITQRIETAERSGSPLSDSTLRELERERTMYEGVVRLGNGTPRPLGNGDTTASPLPPSTSGAVPRAIAPQTPPAVPAASRPATPPPTAPARRP